MRIKCNYLIKDKKAVRLIVRIKAVENTILEAQLLLVKITSNFKRGNPSFQYVSSMLNRLRKQLRQSIINKKLCQNPLNPGFWRSDIFID